jgi:hypothetical protein
MLGASFLQFAGKGLLLIGAPTIKIKDGDESAMN